jgi:REP element-mobilizing transposase RayT
VSNNPVKHHRRSLRLKGFDYSQPGTYFITVCVRNRECLFGEIRAGKTCLNDAGQMVAKWWLELEHKFLGITPGEFMVMPNHFHGIIYIIAPAVVGADLRVGLDARVSPGAPGEEIVAADQGAHAGAPLPEVVQWFKTMTTNEYIRGVKNLGWPRFPGKLWQRNYYEHIIQNQAELEGIYLYIESNALKWEQDQLHPSAPSKW